MWLWDKLSKILLYLFLSSSSVASSLDVCIKQVDRLSASCSSIGEFLKMDLFQSSFLVSLYSQNKVCLKDASLPWTLNFAAGTWFTFERKYDQDRYFQIPYFGKAQDSVHLIIAITLPVQLVLCHSSPTREHSAAALDKWRIIISEEMTTNHGTTATREKPSDEMLVANHVLHILNLYNHDNQCSTFQVFRRRSHKFTSTLHVTSHTLFHRAFPRQVVEIFSANIGSHIGFLSDVSFLLYTFGTVFSSFGYFRPFKHELGWCKYHTPRAPRAHSPQGICLIGSDQ